MIPFSKLKDVQVVDVAGSDVSSHDLRPNKINLVNTVEPDGWRLGFTVFCNSRALEEKIEKRWHFYDGNMLPQRPYPVTLVDQDRLMDFGINVPFVNGYVVQPVYVLATQTDFVTVPMEILKFLMYAYQEIRIQNNVADFTGSHQDVVLYLHELYSSIFTNIENYERCGMVRGVTYQLSRDFDRFHVILMEQIHFTMHMKQKILNIRTTPPNHKKGTNKDAALDYAIKDFFGDLFECDRKFFQRHDH